MKHAATESNRWIGAGLDGLEIARAWAMVEVASLTTIDDSVRTLIATLAISDIRAVVGAGGVTAPEELLLSEAISLLRERKYGAANGLLYGLTVKRILAGGAE